MLKHTFKELYELKVEAHDRNKNKLPYENKPVESKLKVVNKSKENESTNDDKKGKNKKAKKPRDWEAFKKNKKMIKQVRKYDRSGAIIEDGECLFHGFRDVYSFTFAYFHFYHRSFKNSFC